MCAGRDGGAPRRGRSEPRWWRRHLERRGSQARGPVPPTSSRGAILATAHSIGPDAAEVSACPIGRIIAIDPAPNPQNGGPGSNPYETIEPLSEDLELPVETEDAAGVSYSTVYEWDTARRRALLDNGSSTPTSTVIAWDKGGLNPSAVDLDSKTINGKTARGLRLRPAVGGAPRRSGRDRRIGRLLHAPAHRLLRLRPPGPGQRAILRRQGLPAALQRGWRWYLVHDTDSLDDIRLRALARAPGNGAFRVLGLSAWRVPAPGRYVAHAIALIAELVAAVFSNPAQRSPVQSSFEVGRSLAIAGRADAVAVFVELVGVRIGSGSCPPRRARRRRLRRRPRPHRDSTRSPASSAPSARHPRRPAPHVSRCTAWGSRRPRPAQRSSWTSTLLRNTAISLGVRSSSSTFEASTLKTNRSGFAGLLAGGAVMSISWSR